MAAEIKIDWYVRKVLLFSADGIAMCWNETKLVFDIVCGSKASRQEALHKPLECILMRISNRFTTNLQMVWFALICAMHLV